MSRIPLIQLEAVTKTFDAGRAGVRDVTLSIHEGEFVVIAGPSGAGKSTLLNLLGMLDRPESGTYRLAGVDIGPLSESQRDTLRGETIGFVFQSAYVLGAEPMLVNAALALRTIGAPTADRTEAATQALARVGLAGRDHVQAALLSGGERQRLALARAIATNPRLILADEPTGNLDSANGMQVLSLLRQLRDDGATIVLVTHDRDLVAAADRVVEVHDGVVTDSGRAPIDDPERSAGGPGRTRLAALQPERRHTWRRQGRLASFFDDLGDAAAALATRHIRTTMLVAAFMLGIGGLVASIGTSETAAAQVSNRLAAAALDEARVMVPGQPGDEGHGERLADLQASARALDHVVDAATIVQVGGDSAGVSRLANTGAALIPLSVMSTSPNFIALSGAEVVGPDATNLLSRPDASIAVIGQSAAKALGISSPGPGATLWVNGHRVDVVSIVAGGERLNLDTTIIVSGDVLAGLQGTSTLLVRTEAGYPATVADALPTALDAVNPGQFRVETVADLRSLQYGVSNDLGVLIGAVAGLLLCFATLSASSTMYLSVQSRSSEIALRRALGAGRAAVARLFVVEGALVGLAGGALGAILGTGATMALAAIQGWEPVLPVMLGAIGVLLGLASGIVSSTVPAIAASRRQPALALRAAV